jgi:hypothetical protein
LRVHQPSRTLDYTLHHGDRALNKMLVKLRRSNANYVIIGYAIADQYNTHAAEAPEEVVTDSKYIESHDYFRLLGYRSSTD